MARKSVVEAGGGIGIDTSELRQLAVSMRTAATLAKREFRAGMIEAADLVVEDAKRRAEEHSSTIADTIKTRIAGADIEIRAGSEGKPLARLFETGNIRRGRIQPSADPGRRFRHPVFGNRDNWASQATHPFLYPAALFNRVEMRSILVRVFDKALKAQRIDME